VQSHCPPGPNLAEERSKHDIVGGEGREGVEVGGGDKGERGGQRRLAVAEAAAAGTLARGGGGIGRREERQPSPTLKGSGHAGVGRSRSGLTQSRIWSCSELLRRGQKT
jgi:hypothetical protein